MSDQKSTGNAVQSINGDIYRAAEAFSFYELCMSWWKQSSF